MSHARTVRGNTLQFLLSDTGGLDGADLNLAVVTAIVADGSFNATKDVLSFALKTKVATADIREAVMHVGPFAGHYRVQQGLRALSKVGSESAKPTDAFSAMMGDAGVGKVDQGTQKDLDDDDHESDGRRAKRAGELFDRVHGKDSKGTGSRLGENSQTVLRWLQADIYGRLFARPRLGFKTRILLSIAALFPLGMSMPIKDFVLAGKNAGLSDESLWHLHGILKRLFGEGGHQDAAERGFTDALGAKKKDGFGPGKDPFRWD
jgi:alkylhydroperoxidase/carboxymuconolactone decarboxylase family protein YurZ